jgi:hypothetical protein
MYGFQTPNDRKNSTTIVKKAIKSKQQDVCSSKKTYVKARKEGGLTHKVIQQEKHRGKTLKK